MGKRSGITRIIGGIFFDLKVMKKNIYLDYNATAPLRPEVIARMNEILRAPHNASAVHRFGREGRKAIETARAQVAALIGATPAQVIFNSGATEGNNTVLNHFKGQRVLASSIEHPSVLGALAHVTKDYALIPVTPGGWARR